MVNTFSAEETKKVSDLLDLCKSHINDNVTIMHGDCVASNIFFDPMSNDMKLIDPRGQMYGSFLYDLAKFNQSITTPYDFIDSGLFANEYVYEKTRSKYVSIWNEFLRDNFGEWEKTIRIITLSCMCSLIPLHSDKPENQKLYKEWCLENMNDILF
jgi:5-methylthioribose kinase